MTQYGIMHSELHAVIFVNIIIEIYLETSYRKKNCGCINLKKRFSKNSVDLEIWHINKDKK